MILQALVIIGLLYWLMVERQANPYLTIWEKQNWSFISSVTNWTILSAAIAAFAGFSLVWAVHPLLAANFLRIRPPAPLARPSTYPNGFPSRVRGDRLRFELLPPLYELVEFRTFVLVLGLLAQSLALWILTASTFTITDLPADSFFYISHLPFTYWWGLAATTVLFFVGRRETGRLRTILELSTLLLLGLYTLGLPSFVYNTPRILDSYQHMGNSLGLISNSGWLNSPIWYARQFPGAFTFFAQLVLVPGIDSFSLMKYYVVGETSIMVLFVYVITRTHAPNYAAVTTGAFLGALWFQLHLSPQSLELVLYLGLILTLIKVIENPQRSETWTLIALITAPIFIVSHPETVILVIPGILLFLVFIFLRSGTEFRELVPNVGITLLALAGWFAVWWTTFAAEARNLIVSVAQSAIRSLSSIAYHSARTSIPSSPSFSYRVTITSELTISGAIWALGIALILVSRLRLLQREALLGGLFTVAVLTVPVTVFVRTDMLARSYLFSLIPEVILVAWLLERRSLFHIRNRSLHPPFKAILIIGMIVLLAMLPLTRNGNDPEEHVPQSSLFASSVAGGLHQHSVLLINFGEYGYWYYSTLKGSRQSPNDEQANMSMLAGGFIEANSTLSKYDLTLTPSDASSNYILISDYYENLYSLRYGTGSGYYLGQRALFEEQASMKFNLVYSTGSDRLYANQNIP